MPDGVEVCKPLEERLYWWHSRCGSNRDCLNDDRQNHFAIGYCNAVSWCRAFPGYGMFVDVYDPKNQYRLFRMTEHNATYAKFVRCKASIGSVTPFNYTFGDGDDPYTVQIPGITDILKVPGVDSAEARRARADRMKRQHSPLPTGLQWIPPLLNKLDDAQDLLYTALVIGVGLLKVLGVRAIPGLGILLTANDILNAFS
jgi:hypothetical protein